MHQVSPGNDFNRINSPVPAVMPYRFPIGSVFNSIETAGCQEMALPIAVATLF
jgi:hypothetical protein